MLGRARVRCTESPASASRLQGPQEAGLWAGLRLMAHREAARQEPAGTWPSAGWEEAAVLHDAAPLLLAVGFPGRP